MARFNTKRNGSSLEASPHHPHCHACGKPVDLRRMNVLLEAVEKPTAQPTHAIAWHLDCYERYLDDWEEC
jgi:hypothetical protein